MAIKKPLVLTNGLIERLQPGDTLDLANSVEKNNNTGNTLVTATPVYVQSGNAIPAQADSNPTSKVLGLVSADAPDAGPVTIQTSGILTATTAAWDAVTGSTGGLSEGSQYFLSEITAGAMTLIAPDANGDYVVSLGVALSATEFEIEIGQPIRL